MINLLQKHFIQHLIIYIIEATRLFTSIYIITLPRDQLEQGSNKQSVSNFLHTSSSLNQP